MRNSSFNAYKVLHGISAVCLIMALGCGKVMAEPAEAEAVSFEFRGFGTVGLTHSSEHRADFNNYDFQKRGAGYSRSWSPEVDSRIGAQIDASFTPRTSAVLQVISEQRNDGSYRPEIEWANVKHELTPDLSVRVGRFVLPSYMLADSRKVGYAYPWVRPPVEVYNVLPATRTDGIDITYRTQLGGIKNTTELGVGKGSGHVPEGKLEWKDGWGVADTLEYGHATVRLAYIKTKLTADAYRPLFNAYRRFFGAQGAALAEKYEVENRPTTFYSMGASYDPGKWFVTGEFGQANFDSVIGVRRGGYVSSGFRSGKITPYVIYSRASVKSSTNDPGLNNFFSSTLDAQLKESLSMAPVQRSVGVGVRWDVGRNAAFKLQYDRTHLGENSSGTLDNLQPGFQTGGTFNLISATLDFLF